MNNEVIEQGIRLKGNMRVSNYEHFLNYLSKTKRRRKLNE